MNPALLITIIQLAIKAVPSLVAELRLLLAKGDPTDADWDALKEKVSKSYDDYIAEAKRQATPPAV
jgi:hypothetical protein